MAKNILEKIIKRKIVNIEKLKKFCTLIFYSKTSKDFSFLVNIKDCFFSSIIFSKIFVINKIES